MAYSIGANSAGERAASLAGKPILLGHNLLRNQTNPNPASRTGAEWRAGTVGGALPTWAATNKTLSTAPTARASDDYMHLQTWPDSTTPSKRWALLFDLVESATPADSLIIAGHNFGDLATLGADVDVFVYIADAVDFTTNNRRIALWSAVSSNERLVTFNLGPTGQSITNDEESYTSLRYLQINIQDTGNAVDIVPRIGEVYLGRRRQLSRKPQGQWDDKHWRSNNPSHVTYGGVHTTYSRNRGQRIFTPTWGSSGADGVYGLNDITTLESWFVDDLSYGERKFFFVPDPDDSGYGSGAHIDPTPHGPTAYMMHLEDPEFDLLLTGPAERQYGSRFVEQAPFVSSGE